MESARGNIAYYEYLRVYACCMDWMPLKIFIQQSE